MTGAAAAEIGGTVRFGLLGSLEVLDGSAAARRVPAPKQRVILAALLLGRGRTVSAASLAEALWDGSPPPNESAILRTYITRLRRVLGPAGPRIVGSPPGWAVELRSHEEFDLAEVDHLWLMAREQAGAGNWTHASAHLTRALGMWRGEPLVDVPSATLVRREAGMLAELRLALTEARVDADLRLGRHDELVAELRQLVAEHPLREHFRVQLMLACLRCGQQAAALEVYRDAYRTLADELGLEPGRDLQEIHQRILSGDQTLTADVPASVTVRQAVRVEPDDPSQSHLRAGATGAGSPHDGGETSSEERAGLGCQIAAGRGASGSPATWLRESRQAAGLTLQELAERSGVAVQTITDLERGVSARPDPRSIRGLVKALGLPQDQAEELVASCGGEGLPLAIPRQLPAVPRYFVGRRSALGLLARQQGEVGTTGGVTISAISGMAGVGKTALALHWAHRVAARFPDGQRYADLGGFGPSVTPVEPAVALLGLLDGLGVAAERIPRSLEARAALYRSLVAGRRLVIVLDNARDVEQVRPLLPGSPGCLVLVTSRAQLAGLAVGGNAELLALDALSDEEARQLLAVRLGATRVAAEPFAVSELIGLCAGLPLAVAIAAARAVAHPRFPLAGLAAELRDASRRLDGLDAGDAASSIRSVLSWSYQQLGELAARLLRLLAIHPGPGITAPAVASMADIPLPLAQQTLRALADVNLITEYLPGRYTLHDLLRAFAAEQAQAPGYAEDHRAAVGRMLDHYLHSANAADRVLTCVHHDLVTPAAPRAGVIQETFAARDEALAWLEAERAVLVQATRQAGQTGFDVHAWQLAWCMTVFFRLRGHWHDLVATQRIALAAARRLRDLEAQARTYCELGRASAQAGLFRQARTHHRRSLELYQKLGDRNGQAIAHLAIAFVWSSQGQDRKAIDSTLSALCPPPAGKQPPGRPIAQSTHALALNNLGRYLARSGELSEARIRCEQALQLFRDLDSLHGQADTMDSLGFTYQQLGDHDQAISYYRLAADIYRELGDIHQFAQTLARLGESCQAADDLAAAGDAWQQAMHILEGMQHPDAQETQAKLLRLDALNRPSQIA